MLWLYIDKSRLQGIPLNFYCNYLKNSLSIHGNSVYPYRIWLVMTCFCFSMLKIETLAELTNSMPFLVFLRGSLAVHIDHLRFGIICGPLCGSFPVWGTLAIGDRLRRCTHLLQGRSYLYANTQLRT